jgi:hypothetical protein
MAELLESIYQTIQGDIREHCIHIKESIKNSYSGFVTLSNFFNSAAALERNQILNELLARPTVDYEKDLKIIDSKNDMQLEMIKTTNSKIIEIKEDIHILTNNQNQESSTLNTMITMINEFQLSTIKDREERYHYLEIYTRNPHRITKETLKGLET